MYLKTLLYLLIAFCILPFIFQYAGISINISHSLPRGLWKTISKAELERGDIVNLCLPLKPIVQEAKRRGYLKRGSCPGDMTPILKPVAALPGYIVRLDKDGITVNGHFLSNSLIRQKDSQQRPLEHLSYGETKVPDGHLFLFSSYNASSWDSRYFGFVPITRDLKIMRPLFLWD